MHGDYEDLILYGDYSADWTPEQKQEFEDKCEVKDLGKYYEQITREDFDELFSSLGVSFENYTEVEMQNYYLRYKRYQAAYMSLDDGMTSLIEELIRTNEFEDTAIIMYADHSAYFNQQNYYLKNVAAFEYENPAVYNVPLYIYHGSMGFDNENGLSFAATNPKLQREVVSKFTCTFDIVPTVLDLLGYTYNTNLYHGTSIFSDSESIFVSMESGIFNDEFFTMGDELLYGNDESDTDKLIFKNKITEYYNKQEIFEKMYKYDFFAYGNTYNYADISNLVYFAK